MDGLANVLVRDSGETVHVLRPQMSGGVVTGQGKLLQFGTGGSRHHGLGQRVHGYLLGGTLGGTLGGALRGP